MGKSIRKVLAIICTYNPQDRKYNNSFENFSHPWFDAIRSWQMQRDKDLYIDIIVVDDVSGPKTRKKLIEFQKQTKDFYIDFIDNWFPNPFVGFNHALSLFKDKYYDYYAYCASDASFCNKGDLKLLLDDMDENCCFISPQADKDMIQRIDFNKKKPPTRIHLGEAVNAHLYIWTREFMNTYDYKYVDILGSPGGNETFYPYLCAAIKRYQLLSHRVCIHHIGVHDRYLIQPPLTPHCKRDFCNMLDKGVKIGLGFDEVAVNLSTYWNQFLNSTTLFQFKILIIESICLNPIFRNLFNSFNKMNIIPKRIVNFVDKTQGKPYYHKPNPDCFDENGYAKSDDLYHFIKENLFLKKNELDYRKIPFQLYVPN